MLLYPLLIIIQVLQCDRESNAVGWAVAEIAHEARKFKITFLNTSVIVTNLLKPYSTTRARIHSNFVFIRLLALFSFHALFRKIAGGRGAKGYYMRIRQYREFLWGLQEHWPFAGIPGNWRRLVFHYYWHFEALQANAGNVTEISTLFSFHWILAYWLI